MISTLNQYRRFFLRFTFDFVYSLDEAEVLSGLDELDFFPTKVISMETI